MTGEKEVACLGYRFAGFELNLLTRELWRAGEDVPHHLQPRMFDLLAYLIRNRFRIVAKDDVVRDVWGGSAVCSHAIPQCMSALRKALGVPGIFATYSRVGYRFMLPVDILSEAPTGPRVSSRPLSAA